MLFEDDGTVQDVADNDFAKLVENYHQPVFLGNDIRQSWWITHDMCHLADCCLKTATKILTSRKVQ